MVRSFRLTQNLNDDYEFHPFISLSVRNRSCCCRALWPRLIHANLFGNWTWLWKHFVWIRFFRDRQSASQANAFLISFPHFSGIWHSAAGERSWGGQEKNKGVKAADDDDGQMWCLSGITNICLLLQPNKPKKLCSNGFSTSPGGGGCDRDSESFLQEQEIPNLTHDAFFLQI